MTTLFKNLRISLLGSLLIFSASTYAEDDRLCAEFENSHVDENILGAMLQAAEDGNLYRIKPGSSRMGFCINSPMGVVEAEFKNFTGGLAMKDKDQQGSALVSIDVDSLETDSALIGAILKGESFFDTEQYPDILFVSSGVEWLSPKKAILKGELTMRGLTKTVAFYVDFVDTRSESNDEIITVKATTTIQRSEFGMYTLSSMVDDRVSLCMTIDAYKYIEPRSMTAAR